MHEDIAATTIDYLVKCGGYQLSQHDQKVIQAAIKTAYELGWKDARWEDLNRWEELTD